MNVNDQVESYRTFLKKSREEVEKISKKFNDERKGISKDSTHNVWDLKVSDAIKSIFYSSNAFKNLRFYSEEDNDGDLTAPLLVLDPIDGTREFLRGIPECTISLSILNSWSFKDQTNCHWVWNFRTGHEVQLILNKINFAGYKGGVKKKTCLVSRREWDEGIYKNFTRELSLEPIGSIANKLSLLAGGYGECVFSSSSKNIWDIAAGSFILNRLGFSFYEQGALVRNMKKKLFQGPLLWCRPEKFEDFKNFFAYNGVS